MISDPTIIVTCDKCGYEEQFGMTPLVRCSWDMRDLDKQLSRALWRGTKDDNKHICESCVEDEKEQSE